MTDDHKDAIRRGRLQSNVIKAYLETLDIDRRSVKDPATLKKRLSSLDNRLRNEENRLKVLELRQQRMDVLEALRKAESGGYQRDLEKEFVKVAREYAARKGISYAAFREMGVPPKVLTNAGIKRGS